MKTPKNFRLSKQSLIHLSTIKEGGDFTTETDALEYALLLTVRGGIDVDNKQRPDRIKLAHKQKQPS